MKNQKENSAVILVVIYNLRFGAYLDLGSWFFGFI